MQVVSGIKSGGRGGAIFLDYNGLLLNNYFEHNSAFNGAALYSRGGYPRVERCFFNNNIAESNGGAIYWDGEWGEMKLYDCDFNSNNAKYNGIVTAFGRIEVECCNFIKNNANYALDVGCGGSVKNCIFKDNNNQNIVKNFFKEVNVDMCWFGNTQFNAKKDLTKNPFITNNWCVLYEFGDKKVFIEGPFICKIRLKPIIEMIPKVAELAQI